MPFGRGATPLCGMELQMPGLEVARCPAATHGRVLNAVTLAGQGVRLVRSARRRYLRMRVTSEPQCSGHVMEASVQTTQPRAASGAVPIP